MNERKSVRDITPEYDEYSLASLLQEYTRKNAARLWAETAVRETSEAKAAEREAAETRTAEPARPAPTAAPQAAAERPAAAEPMELPEVDTAAIAERSRQAAMSALGETLRHYQAAARKTAPFPENAPAATVAPEMPATEIPAPKPDIAPAEELRRPRFTVGEDGIITLRYAAPVEDDAPSGDISPADEPAPAASTEDENEPYEGEPTPDNGAPRPSRPDRPSFAERFLAPAVRRIATILARRQMQYAEAANWPEPVDIRDTPELTPRKASKYYASLLGPLTLRFRIAIVLTLILTWIGMGLPMAGMLGRSLPLQAGVSLALLLAVMMTALDVVTAGLRQLFDLKPGAETLAAAAAILSCVDAALVLFGHGEALPYCAIGAASLTAAIWGEVLTCRAMRRTLKTAAASKSPSILASDGEDGGTGSLMRDQRDTVEGVVRRSESQDLCRTVYAAAAPFLLGAAVVLAIIASLGEHSGGFFHTLSALVSVSSSFAAFFGFPLPYAIASRKLRSSGAALAGYAGCADIGRTRRIVITDEDLFPPGTVKFQEINIAEGVFLGKVVASTAALIEASGSGVSSLFAELVARRGYILPDTEEFVCHEGGGLSGLVSGERVLVGSAGFMNLMGIRLPQNLPTQNSICTAISGELVGVFVIDYIPVTSVQDALVTLMRGKTRTVFAIRDFNITPRMIGKLFRMPTDNFNFPSFRERYRIADSAEASGERRPIDAVVTRAGMLPLVEAAEAGRKAYNTCRTSAILSLVGAGIGMVIMFLLCRVGSVDTASAGNVLTFMLLWSLPAVILSLGQNR